MLWYSGWKVKDLLNTWNIEDKKGIQMSDRFYNLPIILNDIERQSGGWTRVVKKNGSIKDILEIWDIDNIDDHDDDTEMVQVLRHLKNACEIIDTLTKE